MTIYNRHVQDGDVYVAMVCGFCTFWSKYVEQNDATESWMTMYAYKDRPVKEVIIDYKDIRFCPICGRKLR